MSLKYDNVVDLCPLVSNDKQIVLSTEREACGSREETNDFVCTKCGRRKRSDDFHKNKAKPNGLQAHCKVCTSKQKKILYKKRLRKKNVENGFQVSIHGTHSEADLSEFSRIFADVVRELLDHEKL